MTEAERWQRIEALVLECLRGKKAEILGDPELEHFSVTVKLYTAQRAGRVRAVGFAKQTVHECGT